MPFVYWSEGITFIGIFMMIMGIPCMLIAFLGFNVLNDLGRYPTEAARIFRGLLIKLIFVQMISFSLLWAFFRVFEKTV